MIPSERAKICLKGGYLCWRESPQSKNIFNGWLAGSQVWGWGKEEYLSLTLRKECKCWFLHGDLIPPLLSGFELCSVQKLWEWQPSCSWHKPGFQPDLGFFLELGWLSGTTALALPMEGVLTLVASFLLSFCKLCWSTRGCLNSMLNIKKTHQNPKPV